jgi:hypothetical protein
MSHEDDPIRTVKAKSRIATTIRRAMASTSIIIRITMCGS